MEAKINEVYEYFKSKILTKDFEINELKQYTMKVLVDGKYTFTIWVGNMHIPESVRLYQSDQNFMEIDLSYDESGKLHDLISQDIEDYRNNVTIPQKMAEYERLKKELNIN